MPKKIRELKQLYAGKVTVSGKDGADAKRYQEKEVQAAIERIKEQEQDD